MPGIVAFQDPLDGLTFFTGDNSGHVCSWSESGNRNWCRHVASADQEVRGLMIGSFTNGVGSLYKIFAGMANTENANLLHVLNSRTGMVESSRPRGETIDGWCWYQCNANIAMADINGDGFNNVIQPCDTHYVTAYDHNLESLPVHEKFYGNDGSHKFWGRVGFNQLEIVDLRGYGSDGLRPNFCSSPATTFAYGDSGERLTAMSGYYHDISVGDNPAGRRYHSPFIVRHNRERFIDTDAGFDWTVTPNGNPKIEDDWEVISISHPNIAAVDVTGNGNVELVYSDNDGYVHCFSLDKTEPGNWPFQVTGATMRMSSEVVAFRDVSQGVIIVFSSWGARNSGEDGYLHFVNSNGDEVERVTIPTPGNDHNGALGAPTLFRFAERSNNLLLTIQTIATGNHLYEIEGTSDAEILWQTGRGNFFRTGRSDPPEVQPYFTTIQLIIALSVGGASVIVSCLGIFVVIGIVLLLSIRIGHVKKLVNGTKKTSK